MLPHRERHPLQPGGPYVPSPHRRREPAGIVYGSEYGGVRKQPVQRDQDSLGSTEGDEPVGSDRYLHSVRAVAAENDTGSPEEDAGVGP